MRRLSSIALAITVALALLLAVLSILTAGRPLSAWAADIAARAYLPFAQTATPATPAGSYNCYEYEFGMVWYLSLIHISAPTRAY